MVACVCCFGQTRRYGNRPSEAADITGDDVDVRDESQFEDRARGLVLGLLVGDAFEEWAAPSGPMLGTSLAQLACFTLEGAIRACVRGDHKGICYPPSVIWHAWCRWAHLQGIKGNFGQQWEGGADEWPDGWLRQLGPLAARRGSAPSTVAALQSSLRVPERPPTTSGGHHALTRGFPIAIMGWSDGREAGANVARLSHGQSEGIDAAGLGVEIATQLLLGAGPEAMTAGTGIAGREDLDTAAHALHHGAQVASTANSFDQAATSASKFGKGAVTTACALYGAANGMAAVDGYLIGRHELGWVADRLARDAVDERLHHPSGGEYVNASDPTWWSRYPGW